MRSATLFRLLSLNLRRNFKALVLSSLGIVIGVSSFVFFVALGQGVRGIVTQDILGQLPAQQIEVVPKSYSFSMFKLPGVSLLGNRFDDRAMGRLKGLPGVRSVYGKMNMGAPSRGVIRIPKQLQQRNMPRAIQTEIVAQGISKDAIPQKDILPGMKFEWKPGQTEVPVLVSNRLLQLYNSTMANMRGLPRLSRTAIRLVPPFRLEVGRSVLRTTPHPKGVKVYRCRVVGVSNKAILLGISVPLRFVRHINQHYKPAQSASIYQSAIVVARDPKQLTGLVRAIKKMGYGLSNSQLFARKVGDVIVLITLLLSLISGVILLIAAISISQAFFNFVYERRHQIGLMRSVGATTGAIKGLLLLEASVVGVVSGLVGVGLSFGIIQGVIWGLKRLPTLPFPIEKLFLFPTWLWPTALLFALFFCVFGAFLPAQRAASVDPARVLSEP